jgi:hypothetical protein
MSGDEAPTEHCNKCGLDKSLDAFFKHPKHRTVCKVCKSAQRQVWRAANNQRDRAAARSRYAANPEAARQIARERYANNRDKVAEQFKKRYEREPERFRSYSSEWRRNNPEKEKRNRTQGQRKLQDASLPTATRRGFTWTGWELEIVSDRSRSIADVAKLIGRTYQATAHMRHAVFNDPKTIIHAGLPNHEQE